jgi:hypothetical protein
MHARRYRPQDSARPRISTIAGVLDAGLVGWFGDRWYEHWHHVYPATPGWMLYVTIIALWAIAFVGVEAVMDEGFKLLRHRRIGTRSNQHC